MSQIHQPMNTPTKSFDLDDDTYDEIKSILAKFGRPDLIEALKESRDDDFKVNEKDKKIKEYYEYYEDYSEFESSPDVVVDKEGFWSLK